MSDNYVLDNWSDWRQWGDSCAAMISQGANIAISKLASSPTINSKNTKLIIILLDNYILSTVQRCTLICSKKKGR